MKIKVTVKYNDKIYMSPNCRIKINKNQGIEILIKKNTKFWSVRGELLCLEFKYESPNEPRCVINNIYIT